MLFSWPTIDVQDCNGRGLLLVDAAPGICLVLLGYVPRLLLENQSEFVFHISLEEDWSWRASNRHQMTMFHVTARLLLDNGRVTPPIRRGHRVAKVGALVAIARAEGT